MIKPQTLKGFRDFLPQEARKRQYVIKTMRSVFELYGFEPLETPAIEYDEILTGKYGDEGEKLMYRFEDHGKRKVALRYDQTVPTARVIAQYINELPIPFKRYQIQPVWRAENTQKGRFREFLQCDADIFGSTSPSADAEVIASAAAVVKKLGFTNYIIYVNDRIVFEGLSLKAIAILDKLKKIGEDGVTEELVSSGNAKDIDEAKNLLQSIIDQKPTEYLEKIFKELDYLSVEKQCIQFSPTLARGLDYYTKTIFEIEIPEYPVGSICGGGRFDNLIGMFSGKQIPAVGYAFGFDRILEAMEELKLFPEHIQQSATKVLVTVFNEGMIQKSLFVTSQLRLNEIEAETYLPAGRQGLESNAKLDKQLKYADQKGIPLVVIIGPEEAAKNIITLKDLRKRHQQHMTVDELLLFLHTYR